MAGLGTIRVGKNRRVYCVPIWPVKPAPASNPVRPPCGRRARIGKPRRCTRRGVVVVCLSPCFRDRCAPGSGCATRRRHCAEPNVWMPGPAASNALKPSFRPRTYMRGSSRCRPRSEEHTSELQSLMRISYAVFCLKKKKKQHRTTTKTCVKVYKDRETQNKRNSLITKNLINTVDITQKKHIQNRKQTMIKT